MFKDILLAQERAMVAGFNLKFSKERADLAALNLDFATKKRDEAILLQTATSERVKSALSSGDVGLINDMVKHFSERWESLPGGFLPKL